MLAEDAYEEFDLLSSSVEVSALSTVTDSDGFLTVVLRDHTTAQTTTGEGDEDEEEEEEEDEDEDEFTERANGATALSDDDEFPDIDDVVAADGASSQLPRVAPSARPAQIGELVDDSDESTSSEEEDDDYDSVYEEDEDDLNVSVERVSVQRVSASDGDDSAIIDRVMQHHTSTGFARNFGAHAAISRSLAPNLTSSPAIVPPRSAGDSFDALRAMLESDMDGSIARLRARAAARAAEAEAESQSLQPLELDDLLEFAPTTLEPTTPPPNGAPEEEVIDPFLETAARIAAELAQEEEERTILRPTQATMHDAQEFADFSDLGAAAVVEAPTPSSPSSTRANAYSASSTQAASSAATEVEIASVTTAAAAATTTTSLPSAAAARQGLFLPTSPSSSSSATTHVTTTAGAAAASSPARAAPPLEGSSLFTSEALSFLRFTPDSMRRLQAQFAREQAAFNQQHEHTLEPDADAHIIAPVGADLMDPSFFRS